MKITIGNEYHCISLRDIDLVIFSHDRMTITIPLLSKLIENNIGVVICNRKNDPIGMFQSFNTHSLVFKHLNEQINWKITRKKRLWKMIVEQKIQSEMDALKLLNIENVPFEKYKEYKNSIFNDDQTNREGASAKLYFENLFGQEFTRDEPIVENIALNYGYKIFASYISKCIVSHGLLTQLGIHHIGESNAYNLTYDFIEPFRAIVDIWVYVYIRDSFTTNDKRALIELMQAKIYCDHKWYRVNDAVEIVVNSYINFMNGNTNQIKTFDLSKGIDENVE